MSGTSMTAVDVASVRSLASKARARHPKTLNAAP